MRALFVLLLLSGAALAQDLPAKDLARLQALKKPIVLAGYVPSGYHLEKVEATNDKRFGVSYTIRYAGPNGAHFAVEMATNGIGDVPDGEKQYPFNNPTFGKGDLQWFTPHYWNTGWLSLKPGQPPVYQANGDGLSPEEGVKIAESLYFKK